MNKTFKSLLFLILATTFSFAQTNSVFDADYFDNNGSTPPVKIGKGFNINDVYKQTKSCFTPESSGKSKLVSDNTGGKKTQIKLFYTKTNHEYNELIKKGGSGKINFLNLFSLGGERLKQYSSDINDEEERLIFTMNVDFGKFSYENEPILINEAKKLIEQNNSKDFVKFFGTHYISGIRKESSVSVILTKTRSKETTNEEDSYSVDGNANIPTKGTGNFEINNGSWVNSELLNNEFSVSVEINGPGIDGNDIQNKVKQILNDNQQSKSDAITSVISGAIKNISNSELSGISQYYYTPFDLYGLEGVNWSEEKVKELEKINEAVIDVYEAKTTLEELTSKELFLAEIEQEGVPQEYLSYFSEQHDKSLPQFEQLLQKSNFYFAELEKRYKKCNDVLCTENETCCNNELFLNEIKEFNFNNQIENEFVPFANLYEQVYKIVEEQNKPDCEKKNQGIITIINKSANPYYIYNSEKLIETLASNSSKSYNVNIGYYNFKAVQKSGYAMYATVNNRNVTIQTACEEILVEIGFED